MLHKVCNNAAEDWQLCCASLAIMLLMFCNNAAINVQQCFQFFFKHELPCNCSLIMGTIYLLTQGRMEKRPQRGLICITAGLDLRGPVIRAYIRPQRGRTTRITVRLCDIFEVAPCIVTLFRRSRPAVKHMRPLRGPCVNRYIVPLIIH